MPSLPRPKFNTSHIPALPQIKGRTSLVLLGVIILLIAAGLSIFFLFNAQKQKEENQKKATVQSILAEAKVLPSISHLWKNRFSANTDKALAEKNNDIRFELLTKNFQILALAYTASHDPKIRQTSEKLKDFLKTNYPDQYYSDKYKEEYFTVPCFDTGCGKLSYPQKVSEIITLVKSNKFKDPKTQDAILKKIEEANFIQSKTLQWSRYDGAFRLVFAEYKNQKEKDKKLKELAQKILDFMKTNYPGDFGIANNLGQYRLD